MGYYTHLLRETVLLKHTAGTDSNGHEIFDSEEEIFCRIDFKTALTVSSSGEQVYASGKLMTESDVFVGDVIEYNSEKYKVISVNPKKDITNLAILNTAYFQ